MINDNIIRFFYWKIAAILKNHLKQIPALSISNSRDYYGKICLENNKFTKIYISKNGLDCYDFSKWKKEDVDELIDTICHELAHEFSWEHDELHDRYLKKFKQIVYQNLDKELLKICS